MCVYRYTTKLSFVYLDKLLAIVVGAGMQQRGETVIVLVIDQLFFCMFFFCGMACVTYLNLSWVNLFEG